MSAPLSFINLSPQKLEIETKTRPASISDILGTSPLPSTPLLPPPKKLPESDK